MYFCRAQILIWIYQYKYFTPLWNICMVRSPWLNGLSIIKKIILTTWLSALDFFTITKSAIKLQTEIGRTPKNKICQHLTTRKMVKCHLCILHRWLVRTSQLRHNPYGFNCLKQTKPPDRHLRQIAAVKYAKGTLFSRDQIHTSYRLQCTIVPHHLMTWFPFCHPSPTLPPPHIRLVVLGPTMPSSAHH